MNASATCIQEVLFFVANQSPKEALFARFPVNPKSTLKSLSNGTFGNQKGQSLVFQGAVVEAALSQMSFSLWALMMWETSIFFVGFPQPIVPKFFASGWISSLAFNSAQGLPNVPVGLPSSSIATKLKSALEQSGAGATGGEEKLLSEKICSCCSCCCSCSCCERKKGRGQCWRRKKGPG